MSADDLVALRLRAMKRERKPFYFYNRRSDGVVEFCGGAIEWDFDWRERSLISRIEPSEFNTPTLSKAQLLALKACETNIEYITGKPGGGKSMFATKMIVDELMNGHRPIVTNLALNLTRLQEYIHELGGKAHVLDRVRVLTHEEVFRFYLYRGTVLVLADPVPGQPIDFSVSQTDAAAAGGVFYVIDECHNYFNTKAPIDENSTMFKWASQHRKLKDYCYFVTQSIENVHAKVRRLGQQFNYIRNFRKETFRGFRRGDGFHRSVYLSIPSGGESVPIHEEDFKLDVRGLGSCYFTAGGVGVQPIGVGDGGFQRKGLHMRWLWVVFVVCLLALACGLFLIPRVLGGIGGSMVGHAMHVSSSTVRSEGASSGSRDAAPVVQSVPPGRSESPRVHQATGDVKVTGILWRGSVIIVQMSDGTRRWRDNRQVHFSDDVQSATPSSVILDGEKYFLTSMPRPASDSPAPSDGGRSVGSDRDSKQGEAASSSPAAPDADHVWDPVTGSYKLKNLSPPFMPDVKVK